MGNQSGAGKRLSIIAILMLFVASGGCFYLAEKRFSELFVTALGPVSPPGPSHEAISFDPQGNLVSVSSRGGKFEIDRYSLQGSVVHATVAWGQVEPSQWTLGSDGKSIAWLTGTRQISVQRMPFDGDSSWPAPKTVLAPSPVTAFGVLDSGHVGLILATGELIERDPGTGATGSRLSLGSRVSWAQMRGDYAAVETGDKIFMYRLTGSDWKMVEERSGISDAGEVRLPADGQIVTVEGGAIRLGDEILNTPGKVTQIAMSDQVTIFVSVEFNGIYVLPHGSSQPYRIADAPPGARLAASRTALAYTGVSGTVLRPLSSDSRTTPAGRLLTGPAAALAMAGALGLMLMILSELRGFKSTSARNVVKKASGLQKAAGGTGQSGRQWGHCSLGGCWDQRRVRSFAQDSLDFNGVPAGAG